MHIGAPIESGQTILHYRIVRVLGTGGMGTVYEAEDTRLGRPVAIKLLHAADANEPEARERFLREARAVAALDHRNLSTVHAIEETPDGTLALVMGLYRGQTLFHLIRSGPLPVDQIVSIGAQIAAGLHIAHMAGVLHRDIKPANIFITTAGEVKILDFGLARLANQSHLTRANQVMGTLAYMSPEQLSGGVVDHRSDLWSVGTVLYEMATGHPPFHHPSRSTVMMLICKGEFLPLYRVRPDLPGFVQEAIDGALRINPLERHASAADLSRVLQPGVSSSRSFSGSVPAISSDDATAAIVVVPDRAGSGSFVQSPKPSSRRSQSSSIATRIAVLPLENIGADTDNEYFGDGLTDELISALGQVSGLSVVSRASAFAFKGKNKDLREIGDALHVESILEGSVRRAGTKVRVSLQLSDTRTGFQIWSAKFDREMRDVFELQDELAEATVAAIREKLARNIELPQQSSSRRPPNADAYDIYLRGRFYWNQKTIESVQLAGRCFQDALKLDDSFGDAHAGLADYYSMLGSLGLMPAHEAWPEARASAMHAIALDPDLPEAHIALATVMQFYDWDWNGGRREIEKAIALRPERGQSYESYVIHLMTQGQLEQALAQAQRGLKYDPLSASLLAAQAVLHTYLGQHESSILLARETLKSLPYYELYYALALAYQASGKTQEAVDALQQGLELSRMPLLLGWLGEAHAKNGDTEQAELALKQLIDYANQGSAMPISIAVAATALGKHDLAFEWLERSADARDILIGYLNIMPSFNPLRKDPRYHRLARRMKLAPNTGASEDPVSGELQSRHNHGANI
jgi:serine/threonine protein kinase/tetratricopeptide (TPR) repeat protein